MATSLLYFHLFFHHHSPSDYPPMDMALTVILVASKAEETYKKIRHILTAAYLLLNPSFLGGEVRIDEVHRLSVTRYEHVLLGTIGFNFALNHPITFLASLCKSLHCNLPFPPAVLLW